MRKAAAVKIPLGPTVDCAAPGINNGNYSADSFFSANKLIHHASSFFPQIQIHNIICKQNSLLKL